MTITFYLHLFNFMHMIEAKKSKLFTLLPNIPAEMGII